MALCAVIGGADHWTEVVEFAQGFSGGVPAVFSAIAQRIGVKTGGAGKACLAHAALGDDQTNPLDGAL